MNRTVLLLLIAIIGIGLIGAGALWKSFAEVTEEAVAFSRTNDQQACLDELLNRLSWCSGLRCEISTVAFAHICFQQAPASPDLCERVPSAVLQVPGWASAQCDELEVAKEACTRIHVQAAKACLLSNLAGKQPEEIKPVVKADGDFLGVIPAIDGRVNEVKFFETGDEAIPRDERQYARVFSAVTSRYINWELGFEFPELPEATDFGIRAVYYYPDGEVMGEPMHQAKLEAGWGWSWQNWGLGWSEPGNWPLGDYRVEFFVGDDKVAAATFTMN